MGKHGKPQSNISKFLNSPFMNIVQVVAIGSLFGYVFAAAI